MSASAATRLRQLATQYHGGELDLSSYRRMRAELLDRLTSSEVEPEEAVTTLPQRTRAVPTAPAPPAVSAPKPAPAASGPPPPAAEKNAPRKRSSGIYVVVGLLVVAAAAAGYFYLRPVAPAASNDAAPPPDTTSESYLAIHDFLAADDWSDEQLANFNTRWATLPDDQRVAALDQSWYRDFVERVRSRVKERRALTATADRPGTVEGPLSALASSVGIDISSPDAIVVPVRRPVVSEGGDEDRGAATTTAASQQRPIAATSPTATPPAIAASEKAAVPASTGAATKTASAAVRQAGATASSAAAPLSPPDNSNNPDRCRLELVGSRRPKCRDALAGGGLGPFMIVIGKGGFEMGSRQIAQEEPVHPVTFSKPFAIAEHEASQAEYKAFCSQTGRACEAQPWQGDDYPVVRVSWQDAHDYAAWLSRVTGNKYRLATEAEWEFAARGGGAALYPSGDSLAQTDAVYSENEKLSSPWRRAQKINAAFRLFHTIGNVREWVEDPWSSTYAGAPADGSARASGEGALRVVRGGAYTDLKPKLRFTTREGLEASTRDAITGFRVVRDF
jgi:formylglycine-generating enzyme required for sulfatase activity